jgi:hypothetical protein
MNDPTPQPPPSLADGYFREQFARGPERPLGRGLVGHVPIIATLMLVLGFCELLMAIFCLFFAMLMLALPPEANVGTDMRLASAFYGGISLVLGAAGLLRLLAGYFNLTYRKRGLGIASLGLGLITVFTGFCAPTSIALAVYGLVVYFNDSVLGAFTLGDAGKKRHEIDAAFPPGT